MSEPCGKLKLFGRTVTASSEKEKKGSEPFFEFVPQFVPALQALISLPGGNAGGQGLRIGQADVFNGHAAHAPCNVFRMLAARQYACEPIQCCVGI
jgi:hypothetical protein